MEVAERKSGTCLRVVGAALAALVVATTVGLGPAAPSGGASTQSVEYTITNIGTLGGSICAGFSGQNSFARALSDSGHVVGGSCKFLDPFDRVIGAFSWRNGAMANLGVTGAAYGVNDAGQVVGGTGSPDFESGGAAFVWTGGTLTNLSSVLGGFSRAYDIDNQGRIVGLRGTPPAIDRWKAFIYDTTTGAVTDLGTLGGTFRSTATSVNDEGHVAGWASLPDENTFHAFLWIDGTMTDLGSLAGGSSFAHGVNGTDDVVGRSAAPGGEHAFLWSSGTMSDLGTLGGPFSAAFGINDSGHAVGYALTGTFAQRAFIWRDGVMQDLNDLVPPNSGWTLLEARAINNAGWITGTGRFGSETRAFLLKPAGEDDTPPEIAVPADIAADATSSAGAIVTYEATATDDVDGPVPVTCAPPSGSFLPIGDTTVACEASDSAGNAAEASFNVHVKGAVEQLSDLMAVVATTPAGGLNFMLNRALQAVNTGQISRACGELATFARTVYDLARPPRPKLTIAQAKAFTDSARRIRSVIGC